MTWEIVCKKFIKLCRVTALELICSTYLFGGSTFRTQNQPWYRVYIAFITETPAQPSASPCWRHMSLPPMLSSVMSISANYSGHVGVEWEIGSLFANYVRAHVDHSTEGDTGGIIAWDEKFLQGFRRKICKRRKYLWDQGVDRRIRSNIKTGF
jgi:hypothetical protein